MIGAKQKINGCVSINDPEMCDNISCTVTAPILHPGGCVEITNRSGLRKVLPHNFYPKASTTCPTCKPCPILTTTPCRSWLTTCPTCPPQQPCPKKPKCERQEICMPCPVIQCKSCACSNPVPYQKSV